MVDDQGKEGSITCGPRKTSRMQSTRASECGGNIREGGIMVNGLGDDPSRCSVSRKKKHGVGIK